jgi:hypothetical protein
MDGTARPEWGDSTNRSEQRRCSYEVVMIDLGEGSLQCPLYIRLDADP